MQRQMEDRRAPNQIFYHVNGSSDSVRFSGVGGRRVGEAVVGFAAAVSRQRSTETDQRQT